MPDLNDWKRGDPLTAAHLQESPTAIRALLAATNGALGKNPQVTRDNIAALMFGETTDTGPNGEADLTATLVWVQILYIDGADTVSDFATFKDDWDTEDPVKRIVPATNMADTAGSHDTPIGTKVIVLAVWDSQVSPGLRYLAFPAAVGSGSSVELLLVVAAVPSRDGLYLVQVCPPPTAGVTDGIDFNLNNTGDTSAWQYNDSTNGASLALNQYEINGAGTTLDLAGPVETRAFIGHRKGTATLTTGTASATVPLYLFAPIQIEDPCIPP